MKIIYNEWPAISVPGRSPRPYVIIYHHHHHHHRCNRNRRARPGSIASSFRVTVSTIVARINPWGFTILLKYDLGFRRKCDVSEIYSYGLKYSACIFRCILTKPPPRRRTLYNSYCKIRCSHITTRFSFIRSSPDTSLDYSSVPNLLSSLLGMTTYPYFVFSFYYKCYYLSFYNAGRIRGVIVAL